MNSSSSLSAIEFQARWTNNTRSERSAAQEHFIDLCRLVGAQTPSEVDPTGTFYTFEKSVQTPRGRLGFADVWRRHYFAWEYKRDKKDLIEAYDQLQMYRESLENPPLLVTSDMRRIEIHTNFTNTVKKQRDVELDHIAEGEQLDALRRLFFEPESFKPGQSVSAITEDAAARFAEFAGARSPNRLTKARGAFPRTGAVLPLC